MELFADLAKDQGVTNALNALLSALAAFWLCGLYRRPHDRTAWLGWFVFWCFTALYYVAPVFAPDAIARIGLYVATTSLLIAYVTPTVPAPKPVAKEPSDSTPQPTFNAHVSASARDLIRRKGVFASVVAIVGVSVGIDAVMVSWYGESAAFQLLTAIVMALWAYRLRDVDLGKSLVLLAYALMQLPLHAFPRLLVPPLAAVVAHKELEPSYQHFVQATFVLYAAFKLATVPAVAALIAPPPDEDDEDDDVSEVVGSVE